MRLGRSGAGACRFSLLDWVEKSGLKIDFVVGTHHDPIAYQDLRKLAAG
jgi:hypothetical protein